MKLTKAEKYIVKQLEERLNLQHIPIYRNGCLCSITNFPDEDLYENRGYAYDADIFISDEIVYSLSNAESINSIEVPLFDNAQNMSTVTFDLSYIIKMNATSCKDITISRQLIFKAYDLMQASQIGWNRKDYMMLVERLLKNGFITEADYLESEIKKIVKNQIKKQYLTLLDSAKELGTNLIISSHNDSCCRECSILQDRVFCFNGTSKLYPTVPENVIKYFGFHEDCRHTFQPYIHDVSTLQIYSNEKQKFVTLNPVLYSNRPYVDTRSKDDIETYEKYKAKIKNDNEFWNIKKYYYRQKVYNPESVPKSFSAYQKQIGFYHIS